jgi:YD repeat-containing protein
MRNNLRHLPAAQQTSSFIRTDDAATLLYPSFPKIPVRTLKDGQEIWRGNASILFEDEMENSEGSAQPVDIAIGSSRSISDKSRKGKSPAQPTKLLPLERKARKGPGPSQSENRETNQDGGAKSATGLKRRWFDTGRSLAALQNDVSRTDNDITTPGETSQLTYDADGAPAAKRRREDGSSAAPYLGEEKDTGHTFGDDIGDAKGQENDRDGDNEETVDETDLEQVSAIKHLHMILLAQARSWRSCLRTLKELEDKPNATRYKMLLERQFQEIDDHKEILTKEVLQQSELAKAIRMFAHKTVYGSAVRDTARSLLDFFGRRHVGKPLRETSTVS